jgi:hypothetical protein
MLRTTVSEAFVTEAPNEETEYGTLMRHAAMFEYDSSRQ